MYNHAKTWGVRPSELIGLTDDFAAYCFDEAVATFGNGVVHQLEAIEGKDTKAINRKRQQLFARLMKLPDQVRFRQPERPS